MSSLDYRRRMTFITMLVGEYGVRYKEDKHCKVPQASNSGQITMPLFPILGSEVEKDGWLFSLIHECYHYIHKEDFTMAARHTVDLDSLFGNVLNILVDHNIECSQYGTLYGADNLCRGAHNAAVDKLRSKLVAAPPIIQAIFWLDCEARNTWLHADSPIINIDLTDEGREAADKIAPLLEEYATPRVAGEKNYELCCKIFKHLEKEAEIDKGCTPPAGKGKAGEKAEGDGSEGEASEEGEGQDREGLVDAGYWKEVLKNEHLDRGAPPAANQRTRYKWDELTSSPIQTLPMKELKARPKSCSYNREPLAYSLSARVRNLLKVASQAKWTGGMKLGKINKRKLATISSGNDRVFKKKTTKDILDTAVLVLVDGSGSMSGTRYKCAAQAGAMLADCMGKIRVPCNISVFSSDHDANIILNMKEFDEGVPASTVYSRFGDTAKILNGNSDGEFLLWAADKLASRREKRKVMIVLSDGQPSAYAAGDLVSFTKRVVKDLEKSPIEVYSIGIETSSVKHFYTNWKKINKASELEDKLFAVIKEALIK